MKKNLFISTGYFATISASLIIDLHKKQKKRNKKNYLLIVISKEFSNNKAFQNEVINQIHFAKQVNNWQKIDVIKENDFPLSVYDKDNYNEKIIETLFQGDLIKESFFELYISSLNILSKLSKYMKFSRANIIDEGIGTHLQVKNSEDLSKFKCFYNLISLQFNKEKINYKVNNIQLPKYLLYKKLNKLNSIYKTPKINKKTNLVAISSFYFIKREKFYLISTYKKLIKELLKDNYKVEVKLHPRNNKEDFLELENYLIQINIPLLDMYLKKNKKYIKNVFSMTSTILFMARYIYNINAVFIENDVKDEYTSNINEIYKKYINK